MTPPPKAPRPVFFDDPAIDRLTAIVTALSAEVAVQNERIRSLEAALAQKSVLALGEIDARQPTSAELDDRRARQDAFNARVFYVLQDEIDALTGQG